MRYSRHIPEQIIIDYALGNIQDDTKKQEIREHMKNCTSCQETLESWQNMLAKQPEEETQPSPDLKEALREKFVEQHQPVKRKRRPALVFAVSSFAVIFILFIGFTMYNSSLNTSYEMVQNDDIREEMIQSNPQTKQKDIIPVADFEQVSGVIWLNDVTQEIMLEVDGLSNIANRDYQLWIIDDNDNMEGEILSINGGSSRVFIKGKDVERFKWIKASLEPAGGSEQPTGPDTFIVPLEFGN